MMASKMVNANNKFFLKSNTFMGLWQIGLQLSFNFILKEQIAKSQKGFNQK